MGNGGGWRFLPLGSEVFRVPLVPLHQLGNVGSEPPGAFTASGAGVVAEGFEEVMVVLAYREPVVHLFCLGFAEPAEEEVTGERGTIWRENIDGQPFLNQAM